MSARRRALIFHWREGHHVHLMLPAMILLAVGVHVGALLLFRLVYPEPQSRVFRPVVAYILPSEGEFAASGPWMATSDPALFSSTIPDEKLGGQASVVEYVPSFDQVQATLRPLAVREASKEVLRGNFGSADWVLEARDMGLAEEEKEGGKEEEGVVLRVSGDLGEVVVPRDFPLPMAADAGVVRPLGFWVGVDGAGKLVALFLGQSSGVPEWDRRVEAALKKASFAEREGSEGIRWGYLSVYAQTGGA